MASGAAYNTHMAERTDETDLLRVPLFPLPNVVLFPHAVLPLHIFEERYKAMAADALKARRPIAMALLRPGWEKCYHGRPKIEPVVCVGTILSHERLADGRYNFLLQGSTRARVMREVGDRAYRVAELEALAEEPVDEVELMEDRRRLTMAFQDPRLRCTGIGRKFLQMLGGSIGTAVICDLVAFNFLDRVDLKQSLLAECDVRLRVGQIVEAFETIYSHLQPNLN